MDTFLFRAVNDLAHLSPTLDAIGVFLSKYDEQIIVGTIAACVLVRIFMQPKLLKNWIMGASAAVSGGIMYWLAAESNFFLYFHHARPPFVLQAVNLLGKIPPAQQFASFPSAHAMFFFSLAAAAFVFDRKVGIITGIVALLLSLSKLFVGVHWPSDLLVGALAGIALGAAISFSASALAKKFIPEAVKPRV